jgi:hypothetical protein
LHSAQHAREHPELLGRSRLHATRTKDAAIVSRQTSGLEGLGCQNHQCPLWVNNGHDALKSRCPLYPQKRTLPGHNCMSAKCSDIRDIWEPSDPVTIRIFFSCGIGEIA